MSLASTLLRVVLMLSLLLNGLNAAMASGHEDRGRMAHAVAAGARRNGGVGRSPQRQASHPRSVTIMVAVAAIDAEPMQLGPVGVPPG